MLPYIPYNITLREEKGGHGKYVSPVVYDVSKCKKLYIRCLIVNAEYQKDGKYGRRGGGMSHAIM